MIRSKAFVSTEELGDQYCLIGPYKEASARTEVEACEFPSNGPFYRAVTAMRNQGFKVHCGRWLVDGNPQIILFDIGSAAWKMDGYKQELWDSSNVGIPHLDIECNDAIILGYTVATFIDEVSPPPKRGCQQLSRRPDLSCHFATTQSFPVQALR